MPKKKGQKMKATAEINMEVDEVDDETLRTEGADRTPNRGSGEYVDPSGLRIANGLPVFAEITVPSAVQNVATYDVNGPRLMITHIINENFKSFANTQIVGPFHKSFTSIVGPNGSGKSNVIDSMLFVFGYRANKIRSKKISVLIHNSQENKNMTSCTVAVHFQKIIDTGEGDDEYDVVPNSKFVVSRTAFKDNSSYYKVNDKKVTYKEVASLLRGKGVDLDHNRFLILQGEVEQIAMMKPKAQTEHEEGMLEFLEDIIGSSRYQEPIDLLTQRVETLNELRGEKLNRVKAVEKEKDDLEDVKNEAIGYLTIENDIVKKKHIMFHTYIAECSENEKKAQDQKAEIEENMKEVTEKLNKINEEKKASGKEHKKIYKKYEELSKHCDEMKEEFSSFEKQDVRCREDLKHAKAKAGKLEKVLTQEKKKLEELNAIPEKTEQDVASLTKKKDKLEAEKVKEEQKLAEVMESLKTETAGLQEEKGAKETELIDLQKAVNETKSKMNVAQSEHELYLSNLNSEKSKLAETERNLLKAKQTVKERRDGINDLEKRIPATETALEKAKKDLTAAVSAERKVSEEVRTIRVKVEEARSSLQAAKSKGRVIDALMELKRAGRLPGIHGRLGDLGAIDEKYDVAISTACGPLDNIVVDSIDTAQKCVQFLKSNNIGLATFIGLDKMAKWKEHCKKKISTPENVPRLFDLVRVKEEKVLPAFYFALRDTLVATDIDQATRIAYGRQRFRVVTLGGQLIDQSGTISGGGGRVSKGRMGSTLQTEVELSPKKLEEMEQKLQKGTAEAQSYRENKALLEETVDKLKKSLAQMKHALEKFKMEVEALSTQEVVLEKQKVEQEERVKAAAPDRKTLEDLEKKVGVLRNDFEKAKAAASEKEDEVHALHKQVMEIGGTKLKAAQSQLNFVTTQIDQIMGHITKATVAIKTAKRNAKKTEDKVKNMEEEIVEAEENMKKLREEYKQLEEDATKVLQGYQTAQEHMQEVEHELNKIKATVAGLEEQEQTMQKENIEVKHELEKYQNIVKENQGRLKYWRKELGKLTLHEIDGKEPETLGEISPEVLKGVNKEDLQYEITVQEEKLVQMKPNMAAIAEYRKKEEAYLKRVSELDQITDMRDSQHKQLEELRKQRHQEFMEGFTIITHKLKQMYQMITLGGDAELELIDSLDPFSEGIVFSVRPPKKSWKNISNLSGGEKTLSSLALVFALHHYKPTPLYVMDEIDAALDFKNVSIIANYIKERTKNAQFIIISLRNNMFELADRLIGIFKTYNCTKTVTINPAKICMPSAESIGNVTITANQSTATSVVTSIVDSMIV